jgi:hypothetical protein
MRAPESDYEVLAVSVDGQLLLSSAAAQATQT